MAVSSPTLLASVADKTVTTLRTSVRGLQPSNYQLSSQYRNILALGSLPFVFNAHYRISA